jgi:hypothetical protein
MRCDGVLEVLVGSLKICCPGQRRLFLWWWCEDGLQAILQELLESLR